MGTRGTRDTLTSKRLPNNFLTDYRDLEKRVRRLEEMMAKVLTEQSTPRPATALRLVHPINGRLYNIRFAVVKGVVRLVATRVEEEE